MANQAIFAGKFLISEWRVEQRPWEIGPKWPADLHGLYRAARRCSTTNFVNNFAQSQTKGNFKQAAISDISSDLQRDRAARSADAKLFVKRSALFENHRDRGQRNDVVYDRWLAHKAF